MYTQRRNQGQVAKPITDYRNLQIAQSGAIMSKHSFKQTCNANILKSKLTLTTDFFVYNVHIFLFNLSNEVIIEFHNAGRNLKQDIQTLILLTRIARNHNINKSIKNFVAIPT